MEVHQRIQLKNLCPSQETYQKAQSLLSLANAKTRQGSGFVVKVPAAIPAACAYLASEQLNTGEVSLRSAMSAACISQAEFKDILKKLDAALRTDGGASVDATYTTLVNAYRIHPREEAIACMEDTEAALPHASILRENHGANVLSCAVFYWVCQLMEEPSIQQQTLCHAYSIDPKSFKAIVSLLDKRCDEIADQIKSVLLLKRSNAQASASEPKPTPKATSPQKSPTKSAMRLRAAMRVSTLATTPSKKRTVAFTNLPPEGGAANGDGVPFPETPTKRRRIDTSSPANPSTRISLAKASSTAATAAFHAALHGSPAKQPNGLESASPGVGSSTPRRPRHARVADATPTQTDAQLTPSRSQGQVSPARPPRRRRFRAVFLEQQQWCARDPKVERMWAVADTVFTEMVERFGRPFSQVLAT